MEDILYTVPEVAELLKTSQGYVYRLIDTGLLQALKLGRFKVRRSTLLKFNILIYSKDLDKVCEFLRGKQIDLDNMTITDVAV